MSLLKLPFMMSATLGMHMAGTPPNAPPPSSERAQIPRWREVFLTSAKIAAVIKTPFLLSCVAESAVILAQYFPPPLRSSALISFFLSSLPPPTRPTLSFAIGCLLTLSGGLLRALCYRTLGRFFTFELSIRREHALVTCGPYSVVRHPGYTGTLLTFAGALMAQADFVRRSGLLESVLGTVCVGVWISASGMLIGSLFLRMPKEDAMLKKEFGKEWDEWARRVRYKLVPGVY